MSVSGYVGERVDLVCESYIGYELGLLGVSLSI